MHWLLDVEFKDDLSRYRSGHGAKTPLRARSRRCQQIQAQRQNTQKSASWDTSYELNTRTVPVILHRE
jgi:hypothetical protein